LLRSANSTESPLFDLHFALSVFRGHDLLAGGRVLLIVKKQIALSSMFRGLLTSKHQLIHLLAPGQDQHITDLTTADKKQEHKQHKDRQARVQLTGNKRHIISSTRCLRKRKCRIVFSPTSPK
jgi:hypothetical protein